MATTTNYSWSTPDDTALVKDGAAAIRTLGSSVDTTVKNLNPETTLGDLSYRSSTANVNTRLPLGTANQQLRVNSGATAPEWFTPAAAGGMTLISEVVASAVSGIQFTGLGSYKQLLLIWSGVRHSAASSTFALRVNANSSNYNANNLSARNSAMEVGANSLGFIGAYNFGTNIPAFGSQVNDSGNIQSSSFGYVLIDDYTSTTKAKSFQHNFGFNSYESGEIYHVTGNGVWNNTAAITTLDIERTSGTATLTNFTNTSIRLYGVS